MANIVTLQDYETYWTLDDIMDAHEVLDIREALEQEASENGNSNKGS